MIDMKKEFTFEGKRYEVEGDVAVEKEFKLSDKMFCITNAKGFHPKQKIVTEGNVQEFIRLIKEEMHLTPIQNDRLDKLAGDLK